VTIFIREGVVHEVYKESRRMLGIKKSVEFINPDGH